MSLRSSDVVKRVIFLRRRTFRLLAVAPLTALVVALHIDLGSERAFAASGDVSRGTSQEKRQNKVKRRALVGKVQKRNRTNVPDEQDPSSLSCTEVWEELVTILRQHVKARSRTEYAEELTSADFYQRVLVKYYETLDPNKILLLESDWKKETSVSSVNESGSTSGILNTASCKHFEERYDRFQGYLKRHAATMKAAYAPDKLAQVQSNVLKIWSAKNESGDRGPAEKGPPISGGSTPPDAEGDHSWLLDKHPRDLREMVVKAELILAETYAMNRTLEKDDGSAFRTALRMVRRYRASFDYSSKDAALTAMATAVVGALDNHSRLFAESEFENFTMSLSSGFTGLGIEMAEVERGLYIKRVIPGGPAAEQNLLREGDTIVAINGDRNIVVGPISKAQRVLMSGSVDSSVTLDVLRGETVLSGLVVKRGLTPDRSESIRGEVRALGDQKWGYLALDGFIGAYEGLAGTAGQVRDRLETTMSGVAGLVLDLRGNGGGRIDEAGQVVGHFVETGPVVTTLTVGDTDGAVLRDLDDGFFFDKPVVVLIDDRSASAAEIVAGALQAYNRALVVGSPRSYGKGSVQSVAPMGQWQRPVLRLDNTVKMIPLSITGGLKLTTGYYFLPNGRSPQGDGVHADLVLPSVREFEAHEGLNNPHLTNPSPQPSLFENPPPGRPPFHKWMSDEKKDNVIRSLAESDWFRALTKDGDPIDQAFLALQEWARALQAHSDSH